MSQSVKNLPAVQETRVRLLGREVPLEKEMAIHSSILAWRIPWTEKPGRLQSMWSRRATNTFIFSSPPYQSPCLFFSLVMICSLLPPSLFFFSFLSFFLFLLRYFVLSCPCVLQRGLRGTASDPHGSPWSVPAPKASRPGEMKSRHFFSPKDQTLPWPGFFCWLVVTCCD